MQDDKLKIIKILFCALGAILVLGCTAVVSFSLAEKPPEISSEPEAVIKVRENNVDMPVTIKNDTPEEQPVVTERENGVYTIILAGNDQGNGNTDTIMAAKLDTVRHTLNVVSIPRDTLINNAWTVRKLNSVYWAAENNGADGVESLKRNIRRLTGFEADSYAILDLDVLIKAVDSMGGVYYDVPMKMDYEDSSQELYIHLEPGYQLLDGEKVMELCRYRSGFIDGDMGRIAQQQSFMKAVLNSFTKLESIPNLPKLLKVLSEGLTTDLSKENMAWYIHQILLCGSENISFCTAPSEPAEISGYSYAVLLRDEWLNIVNDCLNPYSSPIQASDIDIVFRNGSSYAGTKGLIDEDYYRPIIPETLPVYAEPAQPEITERPNFAAPEE